jgi:hypothetical protein
MSDGARIEYSKSHLYVYTSETHTHGFIYHIYNVMGIHDGEYENVVSGVLRRVAFVRTKVS